MGWRSERAGFIDWTLLTGIDAGTAAMSAVKEVSSENMHGAEVLILCWEGALL